MELTATLDDASVEKLFREEVRAWVDRHMTKAKLLTTAQAAKLWSVKETTFLRLAKAYGLKEIQISQRGTRWRLSEVEALVDQIAAATATTKGGLA